MTTSSNRLVHESSPYLLQHAHNPVDWFPWGEEAFAVARREHKPIFLSIGYSACHWCHVMERESFENPEIARLMNELFVNIKVDREERPDLDQIYMNAVQMLTGRGGWPMSVFLTPEGKPFYGGTYYPPSDRHGMPGFPRVLTAIAQAFRERTDEVDKSVQQIMDGLRRIEGHSPSPQALDAGLVADAAARLAQAYDPEHGGLGQAPKFPNESVFELFLRAYVNGGERRYLDMTLHTLRNMARGGLYDQLGGGFHRYSVDARWLVPHFEKMLYDNAQLVPLYLAAYQLTGEQLFARTARDTLDYVLREMRDPLGCFYSTQDADSEGEEGKFFVWQAAELQALLGAEAAAIAGCHWGVSEEGNFEGRNILHVAVDVDRLAAQFARSPEAIAAVLAEARATLFAARERRIKPARDEKSLTAWNGLMISAFAKAAEVLRDERYGEVARSGVRFVETILQKDDRLLSTYKDGTAKLNGYLDDYAFFVAALLDVFELTQDEHLLGRAVALAESTLRHFWDAEGGGFFFTSDDHEQLIVRSKPLFDGSIPSGNSTMVRNLLRLHSLTGNAVYLERAEEVLGQYGGAMRQQSFGLSNMICAADLLIGTADEIVIVGEPDDPGVRQMRAVIGGTYLPNRVLRVLRPSATDRLPGELRGKRAVDGRATAYVCRQRSCSAPVTSAAELEALVTRR